MGKAITHTEINQADAQLKNCRVKTCPNAGADKAAESTTYCGACKAANKVVKAHGRSGTRAPR